MHYPLWLNGEVQITNKGEHIMEIHEKEYGSKGATGAALGTGIAGLSLGVLNSGILGNLGIGGKANCPDQAYVNRYEAEQNAKIASLESEIKLRDAATYTLGEVNKMRNYVDAKFDAINAQLCTQAVVNAQVTANISCMQNAINVLNGLTKTVVPITSICPIPAVATTTT